MISNKEKNFISAVVYVYNQEKEIKNILKTINEVLKNNFNKYEIICVNDASTDNSASIIKEYSKELENEVLTLVNMSYYQGIELAMNAGVDLAIGDFVYEFDNIMYDYKEDTIMEVYRKCLEGFDIVSATSKKNKNTISSIFYTIFNRYSNMKEKIHTETFRILSRRAINRVHSISKNIPYRKAVYANCGLKMYNLIYDPNKKYKRVFNKDVQKTRQETATNSLILFTSLGYKFSMTMSILMMIITILVAIYTLIIFAVGAPVAGWTTTMLFLAFGFFGLFSIMTIIIKYLEVLIGLVFKKTKYTIESINKLN